MPGYYETWCEEMRQNYTSMFEKACLELMELLKGKSRYQEIIKYAGKLLEQDKLNGDAHVNLIEAYAKAGNENMAKDRFAMMLKIYDEELGEKPERKFMERISKIMIS